MPPDTSPTDVRSVRGSKIVALPLGEAGGVGAGAGGLPPVLVVAGGGGVGGDGPLSVPATPLPCDVVRLDVPVKGVDGSSRLQPVTNTTALKSAAGR